MKKRLMAVLLCVCMAAVLLTPYASVLTARGALTLGFAGADGSLTEGGDDVTLPEEAAKPEENQEQSEATEPTATPEPTAEPTAATAEPEATEATATTAPEATKAPVPEYTLDSNGAVYKDGKTLRGDPQDYVVKAQWQALAYKNPTDSTQAKTYEAGTRVRRDDEIEYEDCDGIEWKWSVVLDGNDFYFVLSQALELAPAQEETKTEVKSLGSFANIVNPANIINPDTTKVATYKFYNGETLVDTQNIKNDEMLKEPTAPIASDGQVFDGWYTAVEDGEKFTSFGTALTVTETATINLYARFKTVYTINFYTPDGGTQKLTREVCDHNEHDFSDLSYDVGSTAKVTGWAADINGTVDISTAIKVPEGKTSVSVYAIVTEGYWVVFNTQGGTAVAPVFRAANTTLDLDTVTATTRTGYTFDGWYKNADYAGDKVTTVSSATTLYAKWTPQTANLTVVFWYENADNDEYSYMDSKTVTATTGSEVKSGDYSAMEFDGRDNEHFTINTDKVETVTVAGDGSSKLNVYFKRNQYTLTFTTGGSTNTTCGKTAHTHGGYCYVFGELICSKEEHTHTSACYSSGVVATITAKYDAKISGEFSKAPFTTDYSGRAWKCTDSSKYSYALQTLDRMPGFDATFNLYTKSSNKEKTIYYYVQKIGTTVDSKTWPSSAANFDLLKQVNTYFNWATYDEEYHEILGFTRYSAKVAGFSNDTKSFKNNKLDLYYMRNSYTLKFYNYNVELTDKQQTVQYEAQLKGYLFTPDYPAGLEEGLYTFEGWYTDQYFQNKVTDTLTMPASDVMLYAKWVPASYTVKFYLGYEGATGAPKDQTVEAKKKATPPDDPTREGYKFLGWYEGDEPFSFETEILKDTTLTAKWFSENTFTVVYDANGGDGTAPTDATNYADGAGATVKGKGELTPPTNKVFLGWATTATAATADYQPGDTMPIDASNAVDGVITLYAVWGDKPDTTTLTYNANFGETPETKQHALADGTIDLPNNTKVELYGEDTFTRQGYELIGWNTDKDKATAGEKEYELGASVIVDNLGSAANVLYAVWKQSTTTVTVKKVVEGNMGDKTREFHFRAYWNDEASTLNEFNLENNEEEKITNVPIGATLYVQETDSDLIGYVTKVEVWNNGTARLTELTQKDGYYTFEVQAGDMVVFTNTKDVTPDTGVILDSLPYVLILAVVALGAAGVVIRGRRREDD